MKKSSFSSLSPIYGARARRTSLNSRTRPSSSLLVNSSFLACCQFRSFPASPQADRSKVRFRFHLFRLLGGFVDLGSLTSPPLLHPSFLIISILGHFSHFSKTEIFSARDIENISSAELTLSVMIQQMLSNINAIVSR